MFDFCFDFRDVSPSHYEVNFCQNRIQMSMVGESNGTDYYLCIYIKSSRESQCWEAADMGTQKFTHFMYIHVRVCNISIDSMCNVVCSLQYDNEHYFIPC